MPTAAGLYYFAHGVENASRPPVLLIHGAGGTHLHWPPQVRRMEGQRIFAPDLPGHGKSGGIGRQMISEYAESVMDFMKALHLRSAVMVGHSMGSAIALTMAFEHPERVLGLGLLGSGAKLRVAPVILENVAYQPTFLKAVQMVNEMSYSLQFPPRLKELAAKRLAETRPAVLHGDFMACDAFDVRELINRVVVPTLVICGTEDKMTPLKYSEYLCEQIPNAQLCTVPGAGHMVMIEQPSIVVEMLADFLDSIPYRAGK